MKKAARRKTRREMAEEYLKKQKFSDEDMAAIFKILGVDTPLYNAAYNWPPGTKKERAARKAALQKEERERGIKQRVKMRDLTAVMRHVIEDLKLLNEDLWSLIWSRKSLQWHMQHRPEEDFTKRLSAEIEEEQKRIDETDILLNGLYHLLLEYAKITESKYRPTARRRKGTRKSAHDKKMQNNLIDYFVELKKTKTDGTMHAIKLLKITYDLEVKKSTAASEYSRYLRAKTGRKKFGFRDTEKSP